MLFNSLIFTLFLPLVFVVYWFLPSRFRNFHLLISSYIFYFSYSPWFLILLICTSVFDFWCAQRIQKCLSQKSKRAYVLLSILSNLGVLFAFKYFVPLVNFFISGYYRAECDYDDSWLLNNLIIPAGLSFYTFQSLSYTIDVYRGKYKPNDTLYEFLLYVSFFPHMVAGPVVRYNDLMPQFKIQHYFKEIDWPGFFKLCIWGYFKKMVIADNLNDLVTPVFSHVSNFNSSELLLASFLFVIQVYCDFSGYSDIATGTAKLFGINLSLNWRRPLLSRSLHEFWSRNHISITTWFRDYVYISLGGNRVSYGRWLLNIFLVFVISGLWHGAALTFILWGSMHGVLYIIEILGKKRFPDFKAPKPIGWFYLLLFHTLSLIAFRALSTNDLGYIYRHLFFDADWGGLEHMILLKDRLFFYLSLCLVLFLFMKEYLEEHQFSLTFERAKAGLRPIAYVFLLITIFVIGNFNANTFIYFQF